MNKILEACGFKDPSEVREAVIRSRVNAANPAIPKMDIRSDGTDLNPPPRVGIFSPYNVGSRSWTPKHSPSY